MKKYLLTFVKGILIGAVMLVPGMSGGTMAIILGLYDEMISSVNKLMKKDLSGVLFLAAAGMGGVLGLALFSVPMSYLVTHYEIPTLYFFVGAILGGVPLLVRQSKIRSFSLKDLLFVVSGILLVVLMQFIPTDRFIVDTSGGVLAYIILIAVGIFLAVALILPGISGSMVLFMLGLYTPLMDAIKNRDILFILPIALGVVIGILTATSILERFMVKAPRPTYLLILGFLLGSIAEVFPRTIPTLPVLGLSVILMVVAFMAVYQFSKVEMNSKTE